MQLTQLNKADAQDVITLFEGVFTATEGGAEGKLIAELVSNLIKNTKPQDLIACIAVDEGRIIAGLFFSRFIIPNGQKAFLLSPLAVSTSRQGMGVGQQLIRYGLDCLKSQGVELVFTYGDPAFYAKTGFKQITEDTVKAPFTLSQPVGWLAQSLDGQVVQAMQGATKCMEAFNDDRYW